MVWVYVQDERYIAGEHMDVRRDCVSFARHQNNLRENAPLTLTIEHMEALRRTSLCSIAKYRSS